jgi:hypothetical protein
VFTRILDIAVLMLVAVAVLLPRPDARVQLALKVDPEQRARVAELQTALLAKPGDPDVALELSDLFLDGRRPDWALATLTPALDAQPHDHRLLFRRSLALADHFEAPAAYQAAAKALSLCEAGSTARCGQADRDRLELLVSTLARVRHLDMRKDPNSAKIQILKGLRPTYVPRSEPKK